MTLSVARFDHRLYLSVLVAALVLAGCNSAPAPDAQKAAATSTEILWDKYGVPHIFAPDHPSLFQAYGYAQMEAHSELLIRLYAQARAGKIPQFTGVSDPYEVPKNPELAFDTSAADAGVIANQVLAFLRNRGLLED